MRQMMKWSSLNDARMLADSLSTTVIQTPASMATYHAFSVTVYIRLLAALMLNAMNC